MSNLLQLMDDFLSTEIDDSFHRINEYGSPMSMLMLTENKGLLEDACDSYRMEFQIESDATIGNFNIELKDNNVLTVEYTYKDENTSTSRVSTQTLPDDADIETISATIQGDEESKVFVLEIEKKKDN